MPRLGIGATERWLIVVLVAMCAVLGVLAPTFATLPNLFDLLNATAVNIIFGVGLLVVLIAGGIDISFAVAASVVQYVVALALLWLGGGNWFIGLVLAGCAGAALGCLNAFLIYQFQHRLDRGDDRDLQPVLRPAHVPVGRRVDLRPAGLADHPRSPSSA